VFVLDGIAVLDLSEGVAGAYCARLLAGFGADVVKVERPVWGDPLRHTGPFAGDAPDPERSIPFLYVNAGKRGITLDPALTEGREQLLRLVRDVDLLIENWTPAQRRSLGLDFETLRAVNPRLVQVSVTWFGLCGPWSDYAGEEIVAQALSGNLLTTGEPDREPVLIGCNFAQFAGGQAAFAGALVALFHSLRTGQGQLVDCAITEAAADLLDSLAPNALLTGRRQQRSGMHHHGHYPAGLYPARDGWVVLGPGASGWRGLVELIGGPLADPCLAEPSPAAHREEIDRIFADWLRDRNAVEVFHAAQRRRIPFGYVMGPAEMLASSHLRARDFFRSVTHPIAGTTRYPGPPFRFSNAPWRDGHAPLLGEHDAALASAPHAASEVSQAIHRVAAGAAVAPALRGIRVLDLTQVRAGPKATRWLADAGAEVIKIEHRKRPDGRTFNWGGRGSSAAPPRAIPEAEQRAQNRAGLDQLNRNKLGLSLDLTSATGRGLFLRLVAISDVVVDNFSFGALDRLGLGEDTLRAVRPDLIRLSMPAFGTSGPDRDYIAFGWAQEHLGGITGATGYTGGPPLKTGTIVGDPLNGVHAAGALLLALCVRERTGEGALIDLSQQESLIVLVGESVLGYSYNGRVPERRGNLHRHFAPQGVYRCAGDDAWVALCVTSDAEWAALCRVVERPEMAADPRFADAELRRKHDGDVTAAVGAWSRSHGCVEAMTQLQEAGVPAGAVLSQADALANPHSEARGFLIWHTHPDGVRHPYSNVPWRLSHTPAGVRTAAPLLGEHNDVILGGLLGLSAAERERLETAGVTATLSTPMPVAT
jgi:crotonobetainyl-CoA:carnitine CoA-transferase CaiB-like acyl-CoA transferase